MLDNIKNNYNKTDADHNKRLDLLLFICILFIITYVPIVNIFILNKEKNISVESISKKQNITNSFVIGDFVHIPELNVYGLVLNKNMYEILIFDSSSTPHKIYLPQSEIE